MSTVDCQEGDTEDLADIYIGTAGYSYAHWRNGVFYPKVGVTQSQELRHYSGVFAAVEINASFHGVPREETLKSWASKAKAGFQFSFKVPQEITHERRLENIADKWKFFLHDRLLQCLVKTTDSKDEKQHKESCLGPILFQLPPSLHKNIEKLNEISKLVPHGIKVAFEFRHPSWYCREVYETMRVHNFGLCENISPDQSSLHTKEVTANTWHYIRFHKRGDRLVTNYTDKQLSSTAEQLVERRRKGIVQYAYFLNDHEGNGPRNAKTLMKFVKEHSSNKVFVQHWKPDLAAPTIRSLFAKSAGTSSTPINQMKGTGLKPTGSAIRNGSRKTPSLIDSFFSPATKRQKITPSPPSRRPSTVSSTKKGTITSFFTKKI